MNEEALKQMQKLRNIGPACAEQLVGAGIDTPEKLKKLGAKEAFLQIFTKYAYKNCVNACYLYALHGAIEGLDWREISEEKKIEFKAFTKDVRESLKG